MIGSCRLNNKSMRNVRRTDAYQAMAIDLALLGVITKEECEMLLDGGIPSGIVLPDGSSKLASEKVLPSRPGFIQTEPGDTEPGGIEPVDETDESHEPVNGYEIINTETGDAQETVDDEGRTESDN